MNLSIPEFPDLHLGSVYCIGRNYVKHIEEMNSERTADPVVFLKPRSSVIFSGDAVRLPSESSNVHHEVELVVLIGTVCSDLPVNEANRAITAISVGLDITARDIQAKAKKEGLPWTLAKGFDTFAPLGNFVGIDSIPDLQNLDISVKVNNEIRQAGNTSHMIFPVAEIISYLSYRFTLYPGDLIFTGTPEGVSRIDRGDIVEATLGSNLSTLKVHVQS